MWKPGPNGAIQARLDVAFFAPGLSTFVHISGFIFSTTTDTFVACHTNKRPQKTNSKSFKKAVYGKCKKGHL